MSSISRKRSSAVSRGRSVAITNASDRNSSQGRVATDCHVAWRPPHPDASATEQVQSATVNALAAREHERMASPLARAWRSGDRRSRRRTFPIRRDWPSLPVLAITVSPAEMRDGAPVQPMWLTWARELQAIAQTGLAFTVDPYDRERYLAIQSMAARIMAEHSDEAVERIEGLFAGQSGYATPKVDVRGAVFRDDGCILMVREVADGGRWTLPGGWADVNQSPSECVAREVREESGFEVVVRKLAAVYDRERWDHRPSLPFHIYKMFFVCDLAGGAPRTSLETSEIAFFGPDEIPSELSIGRVLPRQIARMFEHARSPELPTDFD
jgi:ADP-ribose pyrophosphatase YjhB (NUDIX family)